jgi:enoyl-CoA hydratase/carnithine racemase
MAPETLFEQDGPVAILTFNRPEARNAMTWAMYETLRDTCERADADPATRVLVLRGAGDQAFVSGTDIRQFLEFRTREDVLDYEARLDRSIGRLWGMRKPTIAMVQGDAVGGGLFTALACDLRIAAERTRWGVPVARTLGNFPAPANLSRLVAAVGPFRARSLAMTARLVDAQEALQMGLVDEVHSREALEPRVRELARHVAGLAPLTLAAVKEATRRVVDRVALEGAEDLLLSCYLSEDFREGVRAFVDRRRPVWQGR